jgi:2-polyprenyl-3-methyl-5-hydroxy-6-metoxy-1,4-benzoquinol methylase
VTPQPPRVALEAAYDLAYYHPWEGQAHLRDKIWRERLQAVAALSPSPGRLLDVGCGEGSFLREAKKAGWNVSGTEFSAAGAEMARMNEVTVFTGELWEARLPSEGFDVATCWHVIEHVADPRRLLLEMQRILVPGGLLVLATPNLHDRLFRLAYLLARRQQLRLYEPQEREVHLFMYSADTLRRLVASTGFTDIRLGFDRGAAAVPGKRAVDALAYGWYRLTGIHWGMGLEVTARKAALPDGKGTTSDIRISAGACPPRMKTQRRPGVPGAYRQHAAPTGDLRAPRCVCQGIAAVAGAHV